jgi:hypothetical protein
VYESIIQHFSIVGENLPERAVLFSLVLVCFWRFRAHLVDDLIDRYSSFTLHHLLAPFASFHECMEKLCPSFVITIHLSHF